VWSILYYLRNNPEKLRWSQRARFEDENIIDIAIELDNKWRKVKSEIDQMKHKLNIVSRKIPRLKDDEYKRAVKEARTLSNIIKQKEKLLSDLSLKREKVLRSIPNIIHESVPVGRDETENQPIRYWGKPKVSKKFLDLFLKENGKYNVKYEVTDQKFIGHADLVEQLGLADVRKAGQVAGARFFYLFTDLVLLEMALIRYAIDFLLRKGFILVEPPFMLRRKPLEGVISFEDFEDMIYKIEKEDLYLIATAEHPLAALHMNETIPKKDLPLLYAGISPCFRKEAGAHGKDTKGIFRVHQFIKIEQFVYSLPEESWKWHEKLIGYAEEIWRELEIPYRIVNICSGDLGAVAAKKYDLEVWMPAQGKYREMVSCSNTTDYQSYRLNIRYSVSRGGPSEGYVHTLNSTAIATTRALTAIIENYYVPEEKKIRVPKVLKGYLESYSDLLNVLVLD